MQSVLNHNSAGNINCSYYTVNTIRGLERESAVGRALDCHAESLIPGTINLLYTENVVFGVSSQLKIKDWFTVIDNY